MAEAERPDEVVVKSGATATGLAIGGTVAGFALMAAGGNAESEELGWLGLGVAVVGPAAGHLYAGEIGHGVLTSTLRAASIASFAVGFDMSFCLFDCSDVSVAQRRSQCGALSPARLMIPALVPLDDCRRALRKYASA